MGDSPRLASDEDDDEDEWEDAPPEANVAPPSTGAHPYRAPAIRDGDRPRTKKRVSLLTPIVACAGGVAALGVMYVLSRVPVHAPPEPVFESAPAVVPPTPSPMTQVISETPAPQTMIAEQAEEMEIAMAFERRDDERIVSMLFPRITTTSCARLRVLESSCGRLRRWPCMRAAHNEFVADGCPAKGLPYR